MGMYNILLCGVHVSAECFFEGEMIDLSVFFFYLFLTCPGTTDGNELSSYILYRASILISETNLSDA